MKLFLKENILSIEHLTPGRFYDGELTPTIYDPVTLQPALPSYIIKCDDGMYRKLPSHIFMTPEEFREYQLNKILK